MVKPNTLDEVKRLVSGVDLLIYAPPASGKTVYQTNRRKQLDLSVFDTDDLECPENSNVEVLMTNYHQLIPILPSQLVIAFVPPEEQFRAGCEYRGLSYKTSWYTDVLESLQQAGSKKNIILINSGAPILYYDRFIHSCLQAIWDCGPLPKVPSPPTKPQKIVTHTKTQKIVDEDSFDPKVVRVVEPIKTGSQLMYKDEDTNADLDDVVLDNTKSLPPIKFADEALSLQILDSCMTKRRLSDVDDSDTSDSIPKVQRTMQMTPPLTDEQRRFVARIFDLLCGLKLPAFDWRKEADYCVNRGTVKFKSFGNFITCTDGKFQFHCSRHLFLKWSH